MPSNKEFVTQIDALAAELEVDASTNGLNNTQLAARLKELKALSEAVEPEAVEPEAEELKAVETGLRIAPGKAVTSKIGILSEDSGIVTADMFAGGDETIKTLIKSGHVIDGKAE